MRRLVNGVLMTLLSPALLPEVSQEAGISEAFTAQLAQVNLKALCSSAYEGLGNVAKRSFEEVWALAEPFAMQRLESLLAEHDARYSKELIRCVGASTPWCASPLQSMTQLQALVALLEAQPAFVASMEQAMSRMGRLLASLNKADTTGTPLTLSDLPSPSLATEADTALACTLLGLTVEAPIAMFEAFSAELHTYLEHTLVNHDDAELRGYRVALLSTAVQVLSARFGDLTQLSALLA
jgi:glycyl-tRNA synthetase beta subunit